MNIELPDKWSEVDELTIKRERPDNPMGTPVILRAVESVGDVSSSLSHRFYLVKEQAPISNEIIDTAETEEEAKTALIDAARDHW